jgi:hypothetical protein
MSTLIARSFLAWLETTALVRAIPHCPHTPVAPCAICEARKETPCAG